MKGITTLFALVLLTVQGIFAQKTVYIPDTWVYNPSTEEYTEGGNPDLQWSFSRSKIIIKLIQNAVV